MENEKYASDLLRIGKTFSRVARISVGCFEASLQRCRSHFQKASSESNWSSCSYSVLASSFSLKLTSWVFMINRAHVLQCWDFSWLAETSRKKKTRQKSRQKSCRRSCDTDPMSSQQRVPRGPDPDFIYATFRGSLHGNDLDENDHFQRLQLIQCSLPGAMLGKI